MTYLANEPLFPGVLFRAGRPTAADYDEAIQALQDAKQQTEPDGRNCAVCHDSGHQAWECHHNPLVMARRAVAHANVWRCYHCGEVFTNHADAADHFSWSPEGAACLVASDIKTLDRLLRWVDDQVEGQVTHRPDENIYKRTLAGVWGQIRAKLSAMHEEARAAQKSAEAAV